VPELPKSACFAWVDVVPVDAGIGDLRAPRRVQWLTDNSSIFAAYRTLEIAAAVNLEPCFTPVESPESNTFVKTFKRDYVRLNPIPERAHRALADRSLDGGLQLKTPAFPSGLPLSAGVHCIN
jgi:transposase InsO family protein